MGMGKLTWRSPIVKAILLLLVLVPMAVFIAQTDFAEVGNKLKNVGYRFLYVLLVTFIAYLFGTLSWYVCLGVYRRNISIFQLFAIRQVGETIGLYNPTSIVGGDLLKSEFLKYHQIPVSIALSSVITSRLTAVLSQLLLFCLALIWLLLSPYSVYILSFTGNYIYLFLALLILLKAGFLFWLLKTGKDMVAQPGTSSRPNKRMQRFNSMLKELKKNIRTDIPAFWQSYLYAAVHWLVGSLEFYLILRFLGYDLPVMSGLLLDMSVIVLKSFAAFVPGQLGAEEMANKLMLAAIGLSGGTVWITVSILRRTRQLLWIVLGFVLLLFIKKDLRYATT